MTHIETLKQVLEALEDARDNHGLHYVNEIVDLRQAIEEAEQAQPVAWIFKPNMELLWPDEIEVENPSECPGYKPLYLSPQPRQPEHGDSARLDWLTNNPLEALDIFGHVKGADAVRWIRQDIDNRIKESA